MYDPAGKRLAVTGGAGFLGRHLVARLRADGLDPIVVRSADFDLRRQEAVRRLYDELRPHAVIHLAASVGGIGANRARPGEFFYDNLAMGIELVEGARRSGVERFVCVGTTCSYPELAPTPFRETSLWDGFPEPTNAPYGIAKRALAMQLLAYRDQFAFPGVFVVPTNLYGPHDEFDPERSHVIPALIRKCVEARDSGSGLVRCWGSGVATRDFLYVEDCADGIAKALRLADGPEPINLGTGRETSIREVADLVRDATGFDGVWGWDEHMPDGQPRRCLDTGRAEEILGFRAFTPLEDGIERTVRWFERSRAGEV